ncbi:MAG: hypothetical protein ISS28_01785 [Candidatus Cloacimonetes bacterium]|nr:hypothetical protein [Candidatus Cloacimonadota bacterium]MBL7085819.1 hypothetical protein [Candidatus Cloacimonadota bacterium]
MKICIKLFFLLTILSLSFSGNLIAKLLPNDEPVTELKAEDVPNDDGGGLIISWKPLHKDKKIIEYRIYRGVTPDTLFYIGKIPVNVKTGVIGDTMRFTDQSWVLFVDATSPAELRREKGQRKGEIGYDVLYRKVPRDMKVYGPLLKEYRILCVIPLKQYLYKTKMKEFTEIDTTKEGKVDTTSTTLAGLKLRQFKYLLTKQIIGKNYYYAVQAVNLNRRTSPLSEIVAGVTTNDPPEKLKEFYAVAYLDTEEMRFEWSLPTFAEDQKQFNIYLYDENGEKHRIFTRADAYPYTPQTNAIVTFDSIKVRFPEFNSTNMKWYRFNIGEQDRANQETLAKDEPIPAEIVENSMDVLPPVPQYFTVEDNPNDKGDQIKIFFDKPYFGISKLTYNNDFTKLFVSYFIRDNELFKVYRITIQINGTKQTEYVLDDKAKFKVDWDYQEPMTISATFQCRNKAKRLYKDVTLPEDYSVSHTFYYDEERSLVELVPTESKNYSFQIYKHNKSSDVYRFPKLLSYMEREYLDRIRYEEVEFRGNPKYCLDDNRLYVSTYLSIENWEEQEPYYTMAIYLEQLEKMNKEMKDEIDKLQKELEETSDKDKVDSLKTLIKNYTNLIEDKPPIVELANEQTTNRDRMKILDKRHCESKRTFKYFIRKTDGKGHFVDTKVYTKKDGDQYFFPQSNWFNKNEIITLIAVLIFGALVYFMIRAAKKGKKLYIRPIAGIQEIDTAIGRATEMGRPILFVPGISGIRDVATLAGLAILAKVAKKAAEYDTKILVPIRDYIVLPIAQEIVKEAHYEAGRPDTYDKNSVFFISIEQFAFVSGVNGIMIREKTATNFYMGMFYAESLLLTETGSMTGAIQIAGTDAITQLPFFITTCDYTLMGEELYAASAYLSKQPLILGTLKAQDYVKLLIVIAVVFGTLLSTIHLTFFMNWFPTK